MSLGDFIDGLRARHCSIAAALVELDGTELRIDPDGGPVRETTLFEIGSITKSVTGTLLATGVLDGSVELTTTVADVLGDVGAANEVTLLTLATHTSGLPRLAPNHAATRSDSNDPYRSFDEAALLDALSQAVLAPKPQPEYSNFGFQLLGHLLEKAIGRGYRDLVIDRVLRPAGCTHARCGDTRADDHRAQGYSGVTPVPHWTQPLAGAGGIELNIVDFGRWIAANTFPDSTPIVDAVRLAQQVHWGDSTVGRGLGWRHHNGGLIHNGGTGGFRSFCGFVPGVAGVGVLTNLGGWEAIDGAAITLLTGVVRKALRH